MVKIVLSVTLEIYKSISMLIKIIITITFDHTFLYIIILLLLYIKSHYLIV